MAGNKAIGGKIVLEGESDYRKAISQINKSMSTMRSEMKLVNSEYKDNANSMDALRAKQSVLEKQFEEQKKKVQLLKGALEDVKEKYGENSDKVKEWQTKLNYALTDLNNLDAELKQNKKYLSEAESSMDGTASSINEFGKSVQDAESGLDVFGDALKANLLSMAIREGISSIADAFGQLKESILDVSLEGTQALNEFAAKTGTSADSLEEFDQIMQNIYSNNFGESMGDISETMSTIKQNIGDIDASGLEEASTYAIMMRDTFGFDTQEQIRSVKMLMDQFGISSKEAYTLLAQGAQQGLDKNGDLLDTINEYSVHFKQLGYDSEEMFNMLINGAENGTFSVDKLGDAVKEFGIRVKDGTADEAFEQLGFSADALKEKFNEGGDAAQQASQEVIQALLNMDDATEQYTLGVTMFGTMFEDLGVDAIASLMNINGAVSTTATTLEDINNIRYNDLESSLESLKRNVIIKFKEPFEDSFDSVNSKVQEFTSRIADGDLSNSFDTIAQAAANCFSAIISGIEFIVENADVAIGLLSGIGTALVVDKAITGISNMVTGFMTLKTTIMAATAEQGLFNAVMSSTPWGIVIGAVAGVTAALIAFASSTSDTNDEFAELDKRIESTNQKVNDIKQSMTDSKTKFDDSKSSIEGNAIAAKTLADNLYSLAGQENLSNEEKTKMKVLVSELNEMYPDLGLTIDEVTGKLNLQRSAVDNVIQSAADMALMEAYQDRLKDSADNVASATMAQADAYSALQDATNILNEKQAEYNRNMELIEEQTIENGVVNTELSNSQYLLGEEILAAKDKVEEARKSYDDATNTLNETQTAFDEITNVVSNFQEELDKTDTQSFDEKVSSMKENFKQGVEEIKKSYEEMYQKAEESINNQIGLFDEWGGSADVSKETLKNNLQDQVDGINEWSENIEKISKTCSEDFVNELKGMGIDSASEVKTLASMTEKELKAYEKTWEEKNKAVAKAAKTQIGDMSDDIVKLERELINTLEADTNKWSSGGQSLGSDFSRGISTGIANRRAAIVNEARAVASAAMAAAKKELDINSPSRRARKEIGWNFGDGISLGFKDKIESVKSAATALSAGSMQGLSTGIYQTNVSNVNIDGTSITKSLVSALSGMKFEVGQDGIARMVETTIRRSRF